jgi:hypothetical protein
MSAAIDGTVWTALRAALPETPTPNNGFFELNGSDCVHFLSIWASVNGLGTYPVTGAIYSSDPGGPSWSIDSTGGSGSVTVTALTGTGLTGTKVSGSFALSLNPNSGASGTKVITNGSFNISF